MEPGKDEESILYAKFASWAGLLRAVILPMSTSECDLKAASRAAVAILFARSMFGSHDGEASLARTIVMTT